MLKSINLFFIFFVLIFFSSASASVIPDEIRSLASSDEQSLSAISSIENNFSSYSETQKKSIQKQIADLNKTLASDSSSEIIRIKTLETIEQLSQIVPEKTKTPSESSDSLPMYINIFRPTPETKISRSVPNEKTTAISLMSTSPIFWDTHSEFRLNALKIMVKYPEFTELVRIIKQSADASRSPVAGDNEAVYQQANLVLERFMDEQFQKTKAVLTPGVLSFENSGLKAELTNSSYIYYRVESADKTDVFKNANIFSKKWLFIGGKYRYFTWTSVSDVVDHFMDWDFSLTSKPVEASYTLLQGTSGKKLIAKKDRYFNSIKGLLVIVDIVGQIDICKKLVEKADIVYKINDAGNLLFNDPEFNDFAAKLLDKNLSTEQKLNALKAFLYSTASGELSSAFRKFLTVLVEELASDALEDLIKGGILERLLKDLLTGWVSYSVKIVNENVPFFNDLIRAQPQYEFQIK